MQPPKFSEVYGRLCSSPANYNAFIFLFQRIPPRAKSKAASLTGVQPNKIPQSSSHTAGIIIKCPTHSLKLPAEVIKIAGLQDMYHMQEWDTLFDALGD